jgi:DNA-binding IclR family transcriptional regulator
MGMTSADRAPALRRAVAVLDLIAGRNDVTFSDVSRELMLARSSTSDLIGTMLNDRLIQRHDDGLAFGPLWLRCAAGLVSAGPVLERFVQEWDATPLLNTHTLSVQSLMGDQTMCIDVRMGRQVLSVTPRAGSRYPVWNGEAGEPILMRLSVPSIENSLSTFGGFCGVNEAVSRDILTWAAQHSTATASTAPINRASTGNYEMSVMIAGDSSETMPTALTLHLPPGSGSGQNTRELSDALHAFALRIGS